MNDEFKMLAKRLSAVFARNPGPTRQALADALPQAVNSLAVIAISKEHTARSRLQAIRELLNLQRRIVSEDLKRDTVALKRRVAEVKIIEGRVAEIRAKVDRDAEARKKRASVAKAVRDIKAAKKIGTEDAT